MATVRPGDRLRCELEPTLCPTCGRPRDEHSRHLRFRLPEPVLAVPEAERQARTWGNDVLMRVRDVGSFVRILVPVKLTGGYTVTFGAWLSVPAADLHRAWETWWTPDYERLQLAGFLANMLPGWETETLAKPVVAAVLNVDHTPYAIGSSDPFVAEILSREWDHELVLRAVAPYDGSNGSTR